jgi:hypothetical protein
MTGKDGTASTKEDLSRRDNITPLCTSERPYAHNERAVAPGHHARPGSRETALKPRLQCGVDGFLEAVKKGQSLGVGKWQELHQDHAGHPLCRVDPEIGVA